MLFTSYEFLIFLLVLFLVYYLFPSQCQWKLLLVASFLFYFTAEPVYCLYILAISISIWLAACRIENIKGKQEKYLKGRKTDWTKEQKKKFIAQMKGAMRWWLSGGLLFNLGILAVVKYSDFTVENINMLMWEAGCSTRLRPLDIAMPMGISFYTLQALGYLTDVYRGTVRAERNFFKIALFISFFPQLVQGPINRFGDLRRTLYAEHSFDRQNVLYGLQRFLWGLFKKLVIADRILVGVNAIIQNPIDYSGGFVFAGMLFYALELYADFTGGIDIAIGVAQVLGVEMAENFNRPYFSKSIQEYWNRWHITMGFWFKDYLFYPISVCKPMRKLSHFLRRHAGEGVGKKVPVYLASLVIWFFTGIWHGAGWNFIVWGLCNWFVIVVSQELKPFYERFHKRFAVGDRWHFRLFQVVRTMLLMSCLRLLDCYRDVSTAFRMFFSMFSGQHWDSMIRGGLLTLGLTTLDFGIILFGLILLVLVSLWQRKGSVRVQIMKFPYWVRFAIWYGLFLCVLLLGAYGIGYESNQFIYNQF